jgi:hypothetical protein
MNATELRTLNEQRLERLRSDAISCVPLRTTAEILYESKVGRPINWKRIHPKEGDFWMARAAQARAGAGDGNLSIVQIDEYMVAADPEGVHAWAVDEADIRMFENGLAIGPDLEYVDEPIPF